MERTYLAPDPGLLRLRVSARAALGVSLGAAAAASAGLGLAASITGGLAALLTLFTVADPSVRRLAVTTTLLPVVGLPVLVAAALLHELPMPRDAIFLGIAFLGAYARRWGPRGHALGVFAFMMFFVVQFLGTGPGHLPQISVAVVLGVAAGGLTRFGVWPIERRTPPVAPSLPPAVRGSGRVRVTTRHAVQVFAACGLAMGIGHLVSDERWYWAVGTVWWVFVNTVSRGDTLIRGFRRVLGTVGGIVVGLGVALPLAGAMVPTAVIVALCVAGIFYTAAVSYSWMTFFVTVMVGLLYGLLGVLTPALLALRVEQTVVGALCAALAVVAVLPVRTHAMSDVWVRQARAAMHATAEAAHRRIAGDVTAGTLSPHAESERLLGRVRHALAPLLHPLSPFPARKARARQILRILDDCARELRALVELAAATPHPHGLRLSHAHRSALATRLADLEAPLESDPRAPFVPAA